ncbi:SDR family oxidoreductase [Nostoc sp. NMS9]|uniref:SDR family oxidoreductase n=1 Tax=Nostoc sp. NMS9 TaxID=2815393 RepID=UPI0025E5F6DF|nr:SDR family oxidoreductase [Nostoc sp. NMS9]MBN3940487.1 SDR family oxidoreductase [Nostoc sp. NMS9]
MNFNTPRTILITGASKGIGRATADYLANQGHKIIGVARRPPKAPFPGQFVSIDLANLEQTKSVLAELTASYSITGLVNNVGLSQAQPLEEINLQDLSNVLDLNLRPAVQLTQALLPSMKQSGWGRIVNISSLAALGFPNRTSYSAAKAGVISLTRTWALELAKTGITVNAIAPGTIETEMFHEKVSPGIKEEHLYSSMIPMGRFGQLDEIAAAIAFFCSDGAAFITGQTLFVDGGASIGRSLI